MEILFWIQSIKNADESYRIQQREDGTTTTCPICRSQENYFKEWNQPFFFVNKICFLRYEVFFKDMQY